MSFNDNLQVITPDSAKGTAAEYLTETSPFIVMVCYNRDQISALKGYKSFVLSGYKQHQTEEREKSSADYGLAINFSLHRLRRYQEHGNIR